MKSVNLAIKTAIEKCKCPVHGSHPKVKINSNGTVSYDCCCDKFQQYIKKQLDSGKMLPRDIAKIITPRR